MVTKRSFSIYHRISLVAIMILVAPVFISDAAAQSLKGRIVGHAIPENIYVIDVGDVEGHTVTTLKAQGLAFLENGEVAEVRATETIDDTHGDGTYRGYEILTFQDGSTVVSQFEGEQKLVENGRYVDFEGSFRYIEGTGRFAGIEGSGTHEGRNHAKSGVGFYVSFEGTYTLASN